MFVWVGVGGGWEKGACVCVWGGGSVCVCGGGGVGGGGEGCMCVCVGGGGVASVCLCVGVGGWGVEEGCMCVCVCVYIVIGADGRIPLIISGDVCQCCRLLATVSVSGSVCKLKK